MKLEELKPAVGSKKKKKRKGRGISAGRGKTAGRGTKGEKARAGKKIPVGFEGGQTPLKLRLPKQKGFKRKRKIFEILNLDKIDKNFKKNEKVNLESLFKKSLIKNKSEVKILADGELLKPLIFDHNLKFSKSTLDKIKKSGGKILETKPKISEKSTKRKIKK
ncbi:50S ribosomal protein L15 [subsurface metagenome]